MTYDGSPDDIHYVEIYPPIGIARVGNSTLGDNGDYFIGPEAPGAEPIPAGGFKDGAGNIKKQAVRFRVYAFRENGTVLGELDDPEKYPLTWRVHVANKKAAWVKFRARDAPETWELRNANVQGWPEGQGHTYGYTNSRNHLIIDPGARSIDGVNRRDIFLDGIFGNNENPLQVRLGELRTDERGRLLVLASDGDSFPVAGGPGTQELQNQFDNNGWVDKMCDGTVKVTVKYRSQHIERDITVNNNATVITAPPKFASGTQAPTTLYDLIEEIYERPKRQQGNYMQNLEVNYYRDIYPLFKSMYLLSWTSEEAANGHGFDWNERLGQPEFSDHTAGNGGRVGAFRRIRNPGLQAANPVSATMPKLSGDNGGNSPAFLTQLQYDRLRKWSQGQFADGVPPIYIPFDQILPENQPSALTRAALEWSIGGSFHPGIECYWIVKDENIYKQENPGQLGNRFRFDNESVTPGDLTKGLSLPWQSDFYACIGNWWPSVRPFHVVTEGRFNARANEFAAGELAESLSLVDDENRSLWARGVLNSAADGELEGAAINLNQVRNWNKLGFVTKRPHGEDDLPEILVETQRAVDLPEILAVQN